MTVPVYKKYKQLFLAYKKYSKYIGQFVIAI